LGLIHEMNKQIDGALLLCPMLDPRENDNLPQRQIISQPKQLDFIEEGSGYMDMAVVATQKSYEKWQSTIHPAVSIADIEFLGNHLDIWYGPGFQEAVSSMIFQKPSCIITGRQDHVVSYKVAYEFAERFPRATYTVMDCAGHLLERGPLVEEMIKDWLERVEMDF